MSLTGKTALVTGGGRGIGKGCAMALAKRGAMVVINDRPGSPDLAATVEEVKAAGGDALAVEADVFSRAGCVSLLQQTLALVDGIDILVSNPAYSRRASFLDCDPDLFDRVIQGTLVGGFHLSQLVARHMVKRGKGGKMVFISSVHAEMPYQNAIAYNAAKAGLNHMAKTIARELVRHKINVNIVEPWLDLIRRANTKLSAPKPWKSRGERYHGPRLGTPADIGSAVAFLASADADYITGTILRVDGGYLHKDT